MSGIKVTGLLEGIFTRPSMYFGEVTLERFDAFICGVEVGSRFKGVWVNEWHDFNKWVIAYYGRKHSPIRSTGLVAIKFGWKKRGFKELVRLWNLYKPVEPEVIEEDSAEY